MDLTLTIEGRQYGDLSDIPPDIRDSYFPESNVDLKGEIALGKGTVIWGPTKLFGDIRIGDDCLVSSFTEIKANQGPVVIGDRVRMQHGCFIDGPSTVGDGTFLGVKVTLPNDKYPPSRRAAGVRIGKNCIIGNGTIFIPGTSVGDNTVIGSAALVTKDIPPDVLAYGSPARVGPPRSEYDTKKKKWEEETG